jgi:hypothetical protein
MRQSSLFLLAILVLLASGSVLADKTEPNEKEWSYDPMNVRATYGEVEPNNACPGQPVACGDVVDPAMINTAGDVDWYQTTLTAGTLLTVGTDAAQYCDPDADDTYIYLYAPDCTTILTQDDDSGPGFYSLIASYSITAGGTYNIKVRHYSASGTGCYKLLVNCTIPQPPPVNDQCSGALPIPRCAPGALNGDLTWAVNDYDPGVGTPPPSCTGYTAAGKDVAYALDLQAGDLCQFSYTLTSADASFYLVSDCANVNDSCLAGADATGAGGTETLAWTCPTTGAYYLICDVYGTNTGGPFTLTYDIQCPVAHVCCVGETCQLVFEGDCAAMGGIWHPEWESCGPPNPCALPHVCCVGEACFLGLETECQALGGAFHPEWDSCSPNPCALPHACCVGETCFVILANECSIMQGVFHPEWDACTPNPCALPHVCCVGEDCTLVLEQECTATQGVFHPEWDSCTPNPCALPHICCVGEDCYVSLPADCEAMGGVFHPEWESCGPPNPCQATSAQPDSWGKVKSLYRH